jgi:hypothetical protein
MRGGADHSVIRWARKEPQDYPEKTGIAPATERHCAGPEGAFGLLGILPRRLHGHCGASVVTAPDTVATQRGIPMKLTDTRERANAWWARVDSNLQPNRYERALEGRLTSTLGAFRAGRRLKSPQAALGAARFGR